MSILAMCLCVWVSVPNNGLYSLLTPQKASLERKEGVLYRIFDRVFQRKNHWLQLTLTDPDKKYHQTLSKCYLYIAFVVDTHFYKLRPLSAYFLFLANNNHKTNIITTQVSFCVTLSYNAPSLSSAGFPEIWLWISSSVSISCWVNALWWQLG